MPPPHTNCLQVSKKDPLVPSPPPQRTGERWTRPEDYLDVGRLWRRSAARLRRRLEPRTEPERPRLLMGMVPFLVLIFLLMIVAVMIIFAAVPGRKYSAPEAEPNEVGTAPPGWLDR